MREELMNNLVGHAIDFSKTKEKNVIFIIGEEKINSLANILIDQMVRQDEEGVVTYFLDNFMSLPRLSAFSQMLESKKKMFVAVRNQEELKMRYGAYIMDSFENIITSQEEEGKNPMLGTYENYENAETNPTAYFDLEQFVKNSL